MKEKVKKEKTTEQEIKTLKGWKNACFVGMFISAMTPFVAVALANYEKYFVQYNGTKVSIGFLVGMMLMGFVIWAITKKKLGDSMITFLVLWIAFAFTLTMLNELINDISTIMWFGAIGIAGTCALQQEEQALQKKIDKKLDIINTAEKELSVEQAKQEIAAKKQKVIVKVKKEKGNE